MGIDANIALGVKPMQIDNPMNALAQMMQIKDAQQQSQLNGMKMDEYSRGVESQNRMRQLMGGFDDDHAGNQRKLLQGGYLKEAQDYGKNQSDIAKTGADAGKVKMETVAKRLDVMGQAYGHILKNPTLDAAGAVFDYLGKNGLFTPEEVAQHKQEAAANPGAIGQMADVAFRSALAAKEQLPKSQTVNAGDRQVNQSVDPVTGRVTEMGSTPILQSADSRASQATQIRGQNMTDARSRDANALTKEANQNVYDPERGVLVNKATGLARPAATMDGKPLAAKEKALTEGQAKSALFGSRMMMANKIFDTLETAGTTKSVPGINSGYGIGGVVNALASTDQQQLMQAKRDFLNAVLRRESGAVIGESEFAGGDKQYFPQIGDDKKTISQKKANREAAMRGVLIDVPDGRKSEILREITGQSQPASGGFKYLGTE